MGNLKTQRWQLAAIFNFGICGILPKLLQMQFYRKKIKFGDFSCNRMKVIRNLKTQDNGRLPCRIFTRAVHSSYCRK